MIEMPLVDVAAVVGGRVDDAGRAASGRDAATRHVVTGQVVTGHVVVDSRLVGPGDLFAALPGDHADGHEFAVDSVRAGAVGVIARRSVGVPAVIVEDVQAALAALAAHVLDVVAPLVVGVTGSSGKTTTKDLMAHVLDPVGPVVASAGSFNNELGLPLTALRAGLGTRVVVLEMGARHRGNIAYLARIARPRIGVVLNVGSAHVGEFGGREQVAATKGELVEALLPAGVAVLNVDDELVAAMAGRTVARVVGVGLGTAAEVRALDVDLDAAARASFTLHAPRGQARVAMLLVGEHQVGNALAAAAVALEAGMGVEDVARRLSTAEAASRWRMQVVERPDGVTVVNDAYNANPESVRAALKALVAMGRGRRTWAVLGEMLELGDTAVAEHDELGRLAVRLNVSRLVAVGAGARAVHTGAVHEGSWGEESTWVADTGEALALLTSELAPGDVVLVKSSRDAGLRHLGDRLAGTLEHPDDRAVVA